MREIKFRIWDTEDMIYPDQNFNFSNAVFWNIKTTGEKTIKVDTLSYQSLMQFTGLKDHNGKEIYEGDIMKWDSEDGEVTGKVVFKESNSEDLNISGFAFEIIKVEEYDHDNPIEFTVVGNIHENPELLDPR